MDPVTVGQQIKQQYPYYAKFPDEMVGNAYLKKYGGLKQELAETEAKAGIQQKKELETSQQKLEQEHQFKQEHPEVSAEEEKKLSLKKDIKERAQALLNVLDKGERGELKGKALQDAINFASGRYAASAAFGEGGKQFTEMELAQLTGTLPTIEIRKQSVIDRILGRVPPQTGRVLDDPLTLRNKMLIATGQEPVSSRSSRQVQTGLPISGGQFIENLGKDIGTNIQGLMAIPGALGDILGGKVSPIEAGKAVGGGILEEYKQLASQPLQTAYEKPVSTLLNVLPFLQASKVAKLRYASKAGQAAKAAETTTPITKILEKASQASKAEKTSATARSIYQGVLSISRKNNAFERLNPNETVGEMIKYGIRGNADDILKSSERVTGKNGILSNVVNEALADVKTPAKIDKVYDVINDSRKGRFSALSPEKIDELGVRITSLPQQKIGNVEVSRLLDFERTLQEEATAHRLAGVRGDTAAMELAKLKFEVADEIGSVIDDAVKQTGNLSKYKDPRIISELKKVSPQLAKDYQNAQSIADLRRLQKPFVRMAKIIEISQNEPSSLGRALFRMPSQIPVLGPILEAGAQQVAVPSATMTAVGIDRLSPLLKILGGGVSPRRNPYGYIGGREYQESQTPY